jgi:hypothetical protein
MKWLAFFVLLVITVFFIAIPVCQMIRFNVGCESYLKSASNDPSIELAKMDLDIALKYLEVNALTNGYSYIFVKNRQSDIGFWYNCLKTARMDLDSIPDDASGLETSNVLMKLRETILDNDGVISPLGIEWYPYQRLMSFFMIIGLFLIFIDLGFLIAILET